MLYKLNPDASDVRTFLPLHATGMAAQGYPEKALEEWLASCPWAALPDAERVLVIEQEVHFEKRSDILAVDRAGNLLVMELKRFQAPRDVIAQALGYAADAASWSYEELNQRALAHFERQGHAHASLLAGYEEAFDVAPGEFSVTQFNQRQRIVIVAESIDREIETTARWLVQRGIEISCVRYRCYRSEDSEFFLDFEPVVRFEEARRTGGSIPQTRPPRSEKEAIAQMPEGPRRLYEDLKKKASKFGSGVTFGATQDYLKFMARHNFAEIHVRKAGNGGLDLLVRPEPFDIPKGGSEVVDGLEVTHVLPDWALNHRFRVEDAAQLEAAARLLRQSYEEVR